MTLPPPTAVGSRISCHEDNAHAVRCAGAETAALTSLTQPAPPTDRSALRPILQWLIDQSRNAIEGGIGVGGVAALLTEDDPAFTELIRSLLVQHRKALADVVRDPTVTHLLREDLDVETLLDSIVGAYLAERGRSGAVAPEWADRGPGDPMARSGARQQLAAGTVNLPNPGRGASLRIEDYRPIERMPPDIRKRDPGPTRFDRDVRRSRRGQPCLGGNYRTTRHRMVRTLDRLRVNLAGRDTGRGLPRTLAVICPIHLPDRAGHTPVTLRPESPRPRA
jgi:hypothetical protein